jgi:DNA-binding Lrp family transcriptional regulator
LISEIERKVLSEVQDLPLVKNPYLEVAKRLGMKEEEVFNLCKNLIERKVIRRIGPSISHRKFGFSSNPMTVLKVPESDLDEVGEKIAKEPDVTHCYGRTGWDYNLFFMIHSKDKEVARKRAQEIVNKTGIEDFKTLFSIRELKKISFQIPKDSEDQGQKEVEK